MPALHEKLEMGTARWGLERSTEKAFLRMTKGEKEGEEEDHVAGLVEQIAHAMLEEEEEDVTSKEKSVWGPHSAAQDPANVWDKRIIENVGALPAATHKRAESEAMELLYMELVRLKMEELAVAQHQLSLYQKALMDARQTSHSGFPSGDGLSSMASSLSFAEQQQHTFEMSYSLPLHGQTVGVGEWVPPSMIQSQSSKQRLGSPVAYPNGRYTVRAAASLGAPSRESGGTGVFLPRCRTGARNLRILESKRKPDLQFPPMSSSTKVVLPSKRKEDLERPSLQYPSFTPMQEVAPEISLPTEWTY